MQCNNNFDRVSCAVYDVVDSGQSTKQGDSKNESNCRVYDVVDSTQSNFNHYSL
jgi:hypothetical protein